MKILIKNQRIFNKHTRILFNIVLFLVLFNLFIFGGLLFHLSLKIKYKFHLVNKLSIKSQYYPNPILNKDEDWYTAIEYQKRLKNGMDVDWSKIKEGMEMFDESEPRDYFNKGLRHVRIRVKERAYETYWGGTWSTKLANAPHVTKNSLTPGDNVDISNLRYRLYEYKSETKDSNIGLDYQIHTSIAQGLLPILAYQASEFKEHPVKQLDNVVSWWKETATWYQNYPKELAFNLLIEFTNDLDQNALVENELPKEEINKFLRENDLTIYSQLTNPLWKDVENYAQKAFLRDQLNKLYTQLIKEIRKISPKRIIIIAPNSISDPYELPYLDIPFGKDLDKYLMVEWHFYAAGPTKRINSPKRWTIGTPVEQQAIIDKIKFAKQWSDDRNIPTWVGAWMANNYSNNPQISQIGEYSIPEQIRFAMFMSCQLNLYQIPHAINSDTKFYDRINNYWIHYPNINYSHVVLDAVINPKVNNDTCLPYEGD